MNIEVFCCSGGMAEGLRRAGVRIDMAFDADPNACESYAENLGHAPVRIDARDLLRMVQAGWSPGTVELFVADPPCTPYSRAGKRLGPADARDMLAVTVQLIALLRPEAYLVANVPGLDDSTNWPIVQRELGGLSKHGYCVADYVSLDAADYGVPQHRVRPFWFGHRSGPCLRWPEPTHCDPARLRNAAIAGTELRPWVSVREALAHLSAADMGRPVRLRWKSNCHPPSSLDAPSMTIPASQPGNGGMTVVSSKRPPIEDDGPATTVRGGGAGHAAPQMVLRRKKTNHRPSSADEPAKTVTRNPNGDGSLLTHDRHPISHPDAPAYTITSKAEQGAQGGSVLAWPWERPATTLDTKEVLAPYGRNGRDGTSQRHHPNAIVLSEKAAGILQGFPEDWTFSGETKRARWSQIGQAMPPPLGEAVGRQLAAWFAAVRAA
jgi:site-specific DNA-cytosine methylase